MLTLTESATYKKNKIIGSFVDVIFEEVLPIFKPNLTPEDDLT